MNLMPHFQRPAIVRLVALSCLLGVLVATGACRKRRASAGSGLAPVATNAPAATLDQLTEAAQVWYLKNHRYPERFEELVTAGLVAKLPALPPGRQLVYDAQNHRVVVR
jgi:hypothetical protein